jgi:hypothetical protein
MPEEKSKPEPSRAGQAEAPAVYPNQPCYSNLLWLVYHEIGKGYSDSSRHTTGSSGADAAWKPGKPTQVDLPKDYFE